MIYRKFSKGDHQIGIIGMGSAVVGANSEEDIIATVRAAVDHGVNLFDMAGGHATIFEAYGKALKGIRDRIYLQVHFGANYTTGEYGWTTDLEEIKRSVAWQLEKLQTDYIDFGFIHCIDEQNDLDTYKNNGVIDYILELKSKGVVRHIGLSSHTPAIVNKFLDMGIIDVVMFSINPLYDCGKGDYGFGENAERHELYCRCQKEGVAITVMKAYSGGQLLDAAKSPFGAALTKNQCLQYALDKPAVISVLPGCGNVDELNDTMRYFEATDEERDYSVIGSFEPVETKGRCVYCKHCHPCPAGLDIALINKYYDLAKLGDNLASEHYATLEKTAEDCIECGHCDSRCPFSVPQSSRMKEIKAYFGK